MCLKLQKFQEIDKQFITAKEVLLFSNKVLSKEFLYDYKLKKRKSLQVGEYIFACHVETNFS